MPKNATRTSRPSNSKARPLEPKGHAAIVSLVRLLARQAAEKDFEALVKMHEAANDNE